MTSYGCYSNAMCACVTSGCCFLHRQHTLKIWWELDEMSRSYHNKCWKIASKPSLLVPHFRPNYTMPLFQKYG